MHPEAPLDRQVGHPIPEQWAPRDASWFNRPHIGGFAPRWHLVGANGMAVCGHPTLLVLNDWHGAQPPAESMKCARCIKRKTPKAEAQLKTTTLPA